MKIKEKITTTPSKVREALEKNGYELNYLKERFKSDNYYVEYTFEKEKKRFFKKKTQMINIVFRKHIDLELDGEHTSNMVIDKINKKI